MLSFMLHHNFSPPKDRPFFSHAFAFDLSIYQFYHPIGIQLIGIQQQSISIFDSSSKKKHQVNSKVLI